MVYGNSVYLLNFSVSLDYFKIKKVTFKKCWEELSALTYFA